MRCNTSGSHQPAWAFALVLLAAALTSIPHLARADDDASSNSSPPVPLAPQYQRRIAAAILLNPSASERLKLLACQTLARLGPEASPAGGALVHALGDESPAVRESAFKALVGMGQFAVQWLLVGIRSKDDNIQSVCAQVLTMQGSRANQSTREHLIAFSCDDSPKLRRLAVGVLGQIGRSSRPVAAALMDRLDDPDPDVRQAARSALRGLGGFDDTVNAQIAHALADASEAPSMLAWVKLIQQHEHWKEILAPQQPAVVQVNPTQPDDIDVPLLPEPGQPTLAELQMWDERRVLTNFFWPAKPLAKDSPQRVEFLMLRLWATDLFERAMACEETIIRTLGLPGSAIALNRELLVKSIATMPIAEVETYERIENFIMAREIIEGIKKAWRRAKVLGADPFATGAGAGQAVGRRLNEILYWPYHTYTRELAALRDGRAPRRVEAVRIIAQLGPLAPDRQEVLRRSLRDSDAEVRRTAAYWLGNARSEQIADAGDWLASLRDPEPHVRFTAIARFRGIGIADDPTLGEAAKVIFRGNAIARDGLISAIERAWREDRPLLTVLNDDAITGLKTLSGTFATAALETVRDKKPRNDIYRMALIQIFDKWANTDDLDLQRRAVQMYRRYAPDAPSAVKLFNRAALSTDRDLRYAATESLVELAEKGVPGLLKLLDQPDPAQRGLALAQLERIGPAAIAAKDAVAKVEREDEDLTIRQMAASTLLTITRSPEAVSELRTSAQFDPPRFVDRYVRGLRHPSRAERIQWAMKLKQTNILAPPVASALLKAVQSGDYAAREGFAHALANAWQAGLSVEEFLREKAINDPDQSTRTCAKSALRAIEQARASKPAQQIQTR